VLPLSSIWLANDWSQEVLAMMESSARGRLASFKALFLLVASRAALVAADGVPLNLCADYNTADTNRSTLPGFPRAAMGSV
jgi:hypothetical protein